MAQYALRPESELVGPVRDAFGAHYEKFRNLAAMMAEQPATAAYVKAEMARILDSMPAAERASLVSAVRAGKSAREVSKIHTRMTRDFPGLK